MNKPNILVIAQDTGTQETFKHLLAQDYDHLIAFNGLDGVAISRMARPAVIFVELKSAQLPAVDVCRALLDHEPVKAIPVFVLAETPEVDGAVTTLANVRGVIQQPIQAERVKSTIAEVLQGKGLPPIGETAPKIAKRDEPIRVLSVDDSSVVRKLVTMILTAEGFNVTTASDGLDGINKAKELKPDVILLDFVMPKMNGFQVCRILQKDDRLRQIPVILVTSKGDKVGDKFVNQLGVTGYITKPFQPEELVTKIHQTLETHQGSLEHEGAPQQPLAPTTAPATQPTAEAGTAVSAAVPTTPQAPTPSTENITALIHEEVSRELTQKIEEKVQEIVKTELAKFVKSLDKRIEKRVIEKMNEYIRRAKKK